MTQHIHSDEIRTLFSTAMSDMYRKEVPQYGDLVELVRDVNKQVLLQESKLKQRMADAGELERLDVERHGAIRLGTAEELAIICRMFAVMGMYPVGYYDLSVAGIPVHSTAFRPIDAKSLEKNPFRVFTSLLRLELLNNDTLAAVAEEILSKRQIVTDAALELIAKFETEGGLDIKDAKMFVAEAIKTFAWHQDVSVDRETYKKLHDAHRLVADVVSFKGPHINHLTPRTLDIDTVQRLMPQRGIDPKRVIEGPPNRDIPILLRQTSFKALEETILFKSDKRDMQAGSHTARFGEIEQRGVALTPKGRKLYDETLAQAREATAVMAAGQDTDDYESVLEETFKIFPDSYKVLYEQGLAFFKYRMNKAFLGQAESIEELIDAGALMVEPQIYEDFLPVSAAGIFQSNLGSETQFNVAASASKGAFENALGRQVIDEMTLYATTQSVSLDKALTALGQRHFLTNIEVV